MNINTINHVRNDCENDRDKEALLIHLANQSEGLTQLMQVVIQNNAWRASHRDLIGKLVEQLSNEKACVPLTAKEEEVRRALSEIKEKLLEDELNQIASIDRYIAFVKQKQGEIKTIDLRRFNHVIQDYHVKTLIESCPNLKALNLISCRYLKSLDVSGLRQLEELDLMDSSLENLAGLSNCPKLKKLYLNFCRSLPVLDVSGLESLEKLHLDESAVEAVIGLSGCSNLKKFSLSCCLLLKALDVSGLESLSKLDLNNSSIEKLTGLSNCPNLKKLYLNSCQSLKALDVSGLVSLSELELNDSSIEKLIGLNDCLALNTLNLSYCESLKIVNVSELGSLKELDLTDSSIEKLTGLSDCKNLGILNASGCQWLKRLNVRGLKGLEKLDLSSCRILKVLEIKGLKGLKELNLSKSSIEKVTGLSDCTALKTLDLSFCLFLKELDVSRLINLQKLDLTDSSIEKIMGLSRCSNLKTLSLRSCRGLKTLDVSGLSHLKNLYLSASSITEITALRTLTSLRVIEINDCSCLVSADLSDLHQLEKVYSNRCPLLRSLGEALSNCMRLECEECPLLTSLPQVPFNADVITDSIEWVSFYVNPKELEEQPFRVLLDLGTHLLADQPMPNIVWLDPHTYQHQEGIDAGGLRRQLVATLSKNVFDEEIQESSCFPFTKTLEGRFFLNPLTDQESIVALRTVARLIALCSHSSLLLGAILPAHFFYALGALSDAEIDQISFHEPLDAKLKEAIYPKIYSALLGSDPLSEEEMKEMDHSSILFHLAIMAKELKHALGTLNSLRNNTEAFIDRVQGKPVTKESFFKCLQFTNDTNNQMQHYFKIYLDRLEPEKVKDLLELFTACRTLGRHPIIITVFSNRETEELPTIHTCSQEVEMPFYISYEQFEEKIEKSFYAMGTFAVA